MTTPVKGSQIIGTHFPPEEGKKLAIFLLNSEVGWDDLKIDLRGLPASLLISAFFNGFLATISEENPTLLNRAKRVKWEFDHDFQYKNADQWIKNFKET